MKQQTFRPLKVSVSTSTVVAQILSKASKLRSCEEFKLVSVSPDRTTEQRDKHRKLVKQLKTRGNDQPDKRFYNKGDLR